jgi:hypothetical protein
MSVNIPFQFIYLYQKHSRMRLTNMKTEIMQVMQEDLRKLWPMTGTEWGS